MFIFDEPYISDIAINYLVESKQPIVLTDFSSKAMPAGLNSLSKDQARELISKNNNGWLYTNSENAIATIVDLVGEDSSIMQKVRFFKNKFEFREATKHLYADILYKEISGEQIEQLRFAEIGKPFIIKPTVGFLSAGVYRVNNENEWTEVKKEILEKTNTAAATFPKDVIDSSTFLIESVIEGTEYAIDVFFNDNNNPVILNILEHRFNGEHDMGDRLYVTSVDIIQTNLSRVEGFLRQLSSIDDFSGLPLHVEIRIDENGTVRPIEVNPLRFAGWCSTDIAYYAFGINVYEYFMENKRPNWDEIFTLKKGREFAIAVLEKRGPVSENLVFDYEKLKASLTSLVKMRPIDYRKLPLFAFLFLETNESNAKEFEFLLTLDPHAFLSTP
jgi:hypothetical protein